MKKAILVVLICRLCIVVNGQQDTVFIKYNADNSGDSLKYVIDTVVFDSKMGRHILTGTTILPWTSNQEIAKAYGLYFKNVTKSDCIKQGEEAYRGSNCINSINNTDSTLTIDINIYDNCCYSFLCDIVVDSAGIVNLIYYGYGSYCFCRCCFGLVYKMNKMKGLEGYRISGIMINGDPKTLKEL